MTLKVRRLGRYLLHRELASGGMATVYVGRLIGPAGFARTVAIKRLHPQFAKTSDFVAMFLDEARIAARIRHPNVVPTLDVVAEQGELFLVMEFVLGESLSKVMSIVAQAKASIEPTIASSIIGGVLAGLHAAHETTNEEREPLEIIHRDVSPQNVLIGSEGTPRIVDFGVAKALGRMQTTQEGQLKGKLAYMPPEQIRSEPVDRRVDVYAAAVVLWEMLAGRRLFFGEPAAIMYAVIEGTIPRPSELRAEAAPLDDVVMRGLARRREDRFDTALEMLEAVERAVAPASAHQVARWLDRWAQTTLNDRRALIEEVETTDPDAPPLTGRSEVQAVAVPTGGTAATKIEGAARPRVPPAESEREREPIAHSGERAPEPPSAPPSPGEALAPDAPFDGEDEAPLATRAPAARSRRRLYVGALMTGALLGVGLLALRLTREDARADRLADAPDPASARAAIASSDAPTAAASPSEAVPEATAATVESAAPASPSASAATARAVPATGPGPRATPTASSATAAPAPSADILYDTIPYVRHKPKP
ncbi:MAG: serine/threonine-protein kinase [Polyangiaceae bacterium]